MSRILVIGAVLAGLALPAAAAERPTLTVYTYDSFTTACAPSTCNHTSTSSSSASTAAEPATPPSVLFLESVCRQIPKSTKC